jgi:hypothetical protein
VTALVHALGPDPTLLYNGQEVGEPGAGNKGFGGEDGRSSIFDYWTMPAMARWVNGHAYDGGLLSDDEQALRTRYAALMRVLTEPAFAEGQLYSIQNANKVSTEYGGSGQWVYGYLRSHATQTYLVLVNLNSQSTYRPRVRVPAEALVLAGLAPGGPTITFTDALSAFIARATPEALPELGVEIELSPQAVRMLKMSAG